MQRRRIRDLMLNEFKLGHKTVEAKKKILLGEK